MMMFGQQVVRELTQTGETVHVVHDPDGNRIAEYDYDPATGTSTLIREYVWMEGRPVAVVEGGQIYFIRTDHIGRPVFATNDLGVKVWEASYLPFGGVHVSTGGIDLRFPGQWFQAESGLHQNWMRDYDPTTGRYIEADPLGLVDGASVYGYALQNPGRWVDPRGECVGPLAIVCYAVAGAALNVAIGILLDQYLGDGCYTWEELGRDAAIGAFFGGYGRAWGMVGAAAGGSARVMTSAGSKTASPASTAIANVTRPGSTPNIAADIDVKTFIQNLVENGFTKRITINSKGDPINILSKGDKLITIYTATSTQGPSAQVMVAGSVVSKIRLVGP
jgi:RHS repeat-associated protein